MLLLHHRHPTPAAPVDETSPQGPADHSPWAERALATLRIAFGAIFRWAVLDKTFALGFATGRAEDRSVGGSPPRRVRCSTSSGGASRCPPRASRSSTTTSSGA